MSMKIETCNGLPLIYEIVKRIFIIQLLYVAI